MLCSILNLFHFIIGPILVEHPKKKKIFHSLGRVLRRKNKEKSKSLTDLTRSPYFGGGGGLKKQGSIESRESVDSSIQGANSVSEDNFEIDGINDNEHENASSICSDQTDDATEENLDIDSHCSQVDDDFDDDDDIKQSETENALERSESGKLLENMPPGTTVSIIIFFVFKYYMCPNRPLFLLSCFRIVFVAFHHFLR